MVTFEELDELLRKWCDEGRKTDFISGLLEPIKEAGYKILDFRLDIGCDPDALGIMGMRLRFGKSYYWTDTVTVETDFTWEPWTTTFRDNRDCQHSLKESTFKCSQAKAVSEAILNFYKYWFVAAEQSHDTAEE